MKKKQNNFLVYAMFRTALFRLKPLEVIVVTFYSPSWLLSEDSEGTFRSLSQAATCPSVYHAL